MSTEYVPSEYVRSPDLMLPEETALVVVDVQEKLLPHIFNRDELEANVGRLIDAASLADVPVVCTEQYPKGLGPTVNSLAGKLEKRLEKISFSSAGCREFREALVGSGRRKMVVCGMETHVCILQTVCDLMSDGYSVYLPVDAIGSRAEKDHDVAIRRMESNGVTVCTTESTLFEWCGEAGTELFSQVRKLVV